MFVSRSLGCLCLLKQKCDNLILAQARVADPDAPDPRLLVEFLKALKKARELRLAFPPCLHPPSPIVSLSASFSS